MIVCASHILFVATVDNMKQRENNYYKEFSGLKTGQRRIKGVLSCQVELSLRATDVHVLNHAIAIVTTVKPA